MENENKSEVMEQQKENIDSDSENKQNKRKYMEGIIISIIIIIAVIALILLMGKSDLKEANKTIEQLQDKISKLEEDIHSYEERINVYEQKEKELQDSKNSIEKEYSEYKEKMKKYEEVEKKEEERKEAVGYDTGITYDQLARTPDDYKGEKVKFTGKVVQVIEGDYTIQIRFAVNNDYDTILFGEYYPSIVSSRILENDEITIYGTSKGIITYKSTLGGNITIPSVHINQIEQ